MFVKSTKNELAFEAKDKTLLKEILHPSNDPVRINYSLAHATVLAGEASTPHALDSSEVYYILEGQGMMHIEKEKQEVKKGDIVFVPPKTIQYIKNTGEITLVFLCIVEPFWQAVNDHVLF